MIAVSDRPNPPSPDAGERREAIARAVAADIVQGACETDPADPDHPDTVCITVSDLEWIARDRVERLALSPAPDADTVMVPELRKALRACVDVLTKHHQWHAAQTDPDPEHGFIPADEYADSALYEQTVEASALANPLLADGPVDAAFAASQVNPDPERCPYCDNTGDVHRIDGEWLGSCDCGANPDPLPSPEPGEVQ